MQTKEADRIHRNCLVEHSFSACHINTGTFSLHIGIGQDRQNAPATKGNVFSFRTVTGSVYIGNRGFHSCIYDDTPVNFTSDILDKGGVGTDAHCQHQYIKFYGFTTLHKGSVTFKAGSTVTKHKGDAVFFQMFLHHRSAFRVQNTGKYPVCQIADSNACHPVT